MKKIRISNTPLPPHEPPDLARILSMLLDRFGGEILINRHAEHDIRTQVVVGPHMMVSRLDPKALVERGKNDLLALGIEDLLTQLANRLG
jgi:hypothetical protein